MKRVAVLVLASVALDPSPALAHGTGGGSGGSGLSVPLLFGGIALLAAGLAARNKLPGPTAWIVAAAGVALAAGSVFVGGNDNERPDVHIAVVEPASGATVRAGQPIAIDVSVDGPLATGPSDSKGGHLHLSVDGELQQMPYTATTEVTLEAGRHTLTLEYVDNEHRSYDPPVEHAVEVTAT